MSTYIAPMPTDFEIIDRHFDAAKEISKTLVTRTERSQRRILSYFTDLCNERGDMQEELEILRKVAEELGIKGE